MELVTVIGSNHFSLGDYITPDPFFQLQSLKEHMGIDSFANYISNPILSILLLLPLSTQGHFCYFLLLR